MSALDQERIWTARKVVFWCKDLPEVCLAWVPSSSFPSVHSTAGSGRGGTRSGSDPSLATRMSWVTMASP